MVTYNIHHTEIGLLGQEKYSRRALELAPLSMRETARFVAALLVSAVAAEECVDAGGVACRLWAVAGECENNPVRFFLRRQPAAPATPGQHARRASRLPRMALSRATPPP